MQQRKGTQTRSNGRQCRRRPLEMGNRQSTTCNMHRGKCNRRHAICNGKNAPDDTRATDNIQTTCAMQRAICSEQHRHAKRKAAGNVQHAADHRQRGKDNAQRATDNVHQTADDMQKGASTCEMQQGNTRYCRISCAASSGQRTSSSKTEALFSTTSAQHGADATHKMQHTTGAAACSKHPRNRQHAAGIETYEMRRTESGRSRNLRLRRGSGLWNHGPRRTEPPSCLGCSVFAGHLAMPPT